MASRMRSVQGAKGEIFSYIRIFMRACYTNPLLPFIPRGFFVQLTRYLGRKIRFCVMFKVLAIWTEDI